MEGVKILIIAGGTASGKTTVAKAIGKATNSLSISHDRYYLSGPDRTNFDHPEALDTNLLVEHLVALKSGKSVGLPIYDFDTHLRSSDTDNVAAKDLIIVEGILSLHYKALRELAHLTVYVDAPADIRLSRRIIRDSAERNRDANSVIAQYNNTVRPMHDLFVQPTKVLADVVLDGTQPPLELVELLLKKMRLAQVI